MPQYVSAHDEGFHGSEADLTLLADLAREHFINGRSKVELARTFGISRFQVARCLDEARRQGIVSITIRDPREPQGGQEAQLVEKLGLARVVIVRPLQGVADADRASRVGEAAMDAARDYIRPGMTIGISWSRALDGAARAFPRLASGEVVQLAGALRVEGSGTMAQVMARLGDLKNVRTYPISAPLVVDQPATARDLMNQPEIADALERANHLDLAIVSIGAWQEGQSSVWDKVSQRDRDEARLAGAVAEVSGRLLGADGRPIHTALDDRTIGVRLSQLANTTSVIAVARGAERLQAVRAAVTGKYVTCLIVDDDLADALLVD